MKEKIEVAGIVLKLDYHEVDLLAVVLSNLHHITNYNENMFSSREFEILDTIKNEIEALS